MLWGTLLVAMYGAIPVLGGLWVVDRWRRRRRNVRGACAQCGKAWGAGGRANAFLVHGQLVCDGCAASVRKRLHWQFAVLGVGAVVATGIAVLGADPAYLILLPPTMFAGVTVVTVYVMKRANRLAQHQIAVGDRSVLEGEADQAASEIGVPATNPPQVSG